jgi:hypothetical protein
MTLQSMVLVAPRPSGMRYVQSSEYDGQQVQNVSTVLTVSLPNLQSRIGPPKTMCYQTQRYAMYESNQLVFETSQVHHAACDAPAL